MWPLLFVVISSSVALTQTFSTALPSVAAHVSVIALGAPLSLNFQNCCCILSELKAVAASWLDANAEYPPCCSICDS